MDSSLAAPAMPKFRGIVTSQLTDTDAILSAGGRQCTFRFAPDEATDVARLIGDLHVGGLTPEELATRSRRIADKVPLLLADFNLLRLLIESDPRRAAVATSGAQLYRDIRRIAERTAARSARSEFLRALVEQRATRRQLIGYALEYYWIVRAAPGLIGPALGWAASTAERSLLQDFLKSELGHDRFLEASLKAAGLGDAEIEQHQPLPATFSLAAALGVHARQHPLSFKASLFLFERAQPAFIDAFDARCAALGLPQAFYRPLRAHADLNDTYRHDDISRQLMTLDTAIDPEACTVTKRNVSLMVETLVRQEHTILAYYADDSAPMPRIFH